MDVADGPLETGERVRSGLTDDCQASMIPSTMLMLDWHGIVLIANTESSSAGILKACI